MEIVNNKELIPLEHYLEEYVKADPAEIAKRCGVEWNEQDGYFGVRFIHRNYRVYFPEFRVEAADNLEQWNSPEDSNQGKIMILRFLLQASSTPGTGKFLAYRDTPWGEVYVRQFTGRCINRLAFSYGNKIQAFKETMEKTGAEKIESGDAGYQIEFFPGYYIRFMIWEADDEFPPSAQILFSDNFAAIFHGEDLVVASEILLNTMKRI